MEKRSAKLSFTLRFTAAFFHRLSQALVDRAYAVGYEDAKKGIPMDSHRVHIDPSQIRKFQP